MSDSEPRDIALLSRAYTALAEARDIPELSELREQAATMERYLRRKQGAEEAARVATDIRLRAERRIGEMLRERVQHEGGTVTSRYRRLPDAFSKMQSSRWQRIAALPEDVFEAELAKAEPTTTRLVKVAKQMEAQSVGSPLQHVDSRACTVDDLHAAAESGVRFGAIYADPPWQYGNQGTRAATDNHYPTMTVDELCELPVSSLAAEDAHLHLWTTNAFLPESFRLMSAWGFTYKSVFVWVKPEMGIGNYWRVSHEFLLLGIRGRCPFRDRGQMSWMLHERGKHSAKPARVRKLIESVSPGPRLELFGRLMSPGWTVWGNQIERTMFDEGVAEAWAFDAASESSGGQMMLAGG